MELAPGILPLPPENRTCSLPCSSNFSPEEIVQYQVHFEEGHDVFDERYQQWMNMYHPDSITPDSPPADLSNAIFPLSSEKKFCSLSQSCFGLTPFREGHVRREEKVEGS